MTKRLLSLLLLLSFVRPAPASAGIPVIDWSNIIQSTISAVEDISQGAQLVLDYQNQIQQYERMLTDAIVPAVYVWDKISQTVDALENVQNTVRNGRAALRGELKDLLDPNYYRSSSCYNSQGARGGCFEGYKKLMAALSDRELEAQEARDQQLEAQLHTLKERAEKEKQLQGSASKVQGQLEAIQYTNQLLDAQYGELKDTRALLITQQQGAAEERRKQIAREAAQQALSDKWHSGDGKFKRSNPGRW
jgi:P-type conjugative transfer protein TrbJ